MASTQFSDGTVAANFVRANPCKGNRLALRMVDSRWPAQQGWVKMEQFVESGYERYTFHYVYNTFTGAVDDMKIVLPGGAKR